MAEAHYVVDLIYDHLGSRRKAQADKVRALKPQRARLVRGGLCLHGHVLSPDNIEEHPRDNSFACKICVNARRRALYARRKAATIQI